MTIKCGTGVPKPFNQLKRLGSIFINYIGSPIALALGSSLKKYSLNEIEESVDDQEHVNEELLKDLEKINPDIETAVNMCYDWNTNVLCDEDDCFVYCDDYYDYYARLVMKNVNDGEVVVNSFQI